MPEFFWHQRDLDSVSELRLSGFGVLGAVRLSPLRILWRALQVYRDVRVISLVSKEWGYSSGSTRGIVVCELREWEKLSPVVLLVVAVNPDILFQCLICAFGLSVAFRMVTGGEMKLHIESFSERPEEMRDELCSAVGGDV